MRFFLAILFFNFSLGFASNCIYSSKEAMLRLKEDESFVFYQQEISIKLNMAGSYQWKEDSLVLSTYSYNGETIVLAIYQINPLQGKLIYAQEEYANIIPKQIKILKELYPSGRAKREYIWSANREGDYVVYSFKVGGYVSSILTYENYLLEGRQLYYLDNPYLALQREEHYKAGVLHGNIYYFEPVDETYYQVTLVLKEKYKNGKLVSSKEPNDLRNYYTSFR